MKARTKMLIAFGTAAVTVLAGYAYADKKRRTAPSGIPYGEGLLIDIDGPPGPAALIEDSIQTHIEDKADFFYVSHVNGREIDNSRVVALASCRQSMMCWGPRANYVSASPTSLTIVGRTEYASLMSALANDIYQVKGTLRFTPVPDRKYVVRGHLGETGSAVWLEEADSRAMIGKKFETNGTGKLGLLEKWQP